MKKIGKNKGITLIALIITIIVMLILVGVTLNVALNGGLFETAKKAARKTEKARINEEIQTIIVAMNADILANKEAYSSDDEYTFFSIPLVKLEENFEVSEEVILTTENDEGTEIRILDFEKMFELGYVDLNEEEGMYISTVPCRYKENDVNIIVEMKENENGVEIVSFSLDTNINVQIKIEQKTEITPTVTVGGNVKSLTEDGVPIPKGFYYVTGTKDTGVVISDNPDDENVENGNNGNQFVWVPVEINPKLEIKIASDQDIKTVRILNSDGYDETINVDSDIFEKTINITNNCVYEVIVTDINDNVKDEIYEADGIYKKLYEPIKNIDGFSAAGATRDAVLDELKDLILKENPEAVLNTKLDIIKEFDNMMVANGTTEDSAIETESVLKYGGFYIGRYEVGRDKTIKKGNTPQNNISYEDAKANVEGMYNDNSKYGVKSGMPSAATWDSIGKWLVNSGEKTYSEVFISSKKWGNFSPETWGVQGRLKNSGSSETYSANNIYDLAGNLREWTTEIKVGETGNIARGDYYFVGGFPNFYSKHLERAAAEETGYRPILYFVD